LEHNIWSEAPTSMSTLKTLIYRLRSKLEYKLIETIYAAGCRLTPEF
jgi:DNA-binding response OmpR family regulator